PDAPRDAAGEEEALRVARRELVTPLGLRTLSPADPRYRPTFGGHRFVRDSAYHQGTVWPWPMGAYVDLLLRRGERDRAR
ncbi:amylo-alpha-1,6-glucosidase, partial [Deinococcus pimensis]|uniref:amylo-alpha-1,6-glucosidase n=1 Tax=Deinococcus pimensis TaxID=309888 RepID=UPI0005EAF4DC